MPHGGKLDFGRLFAQKLRKLIKRRGGRWSILIAQIDPDGIAAAFTIQAILAHLGAQADIFYSGGFGHPQNKMLLNEFELIKYMRPMRELPPDTVIALADSSRFDDSRFRDGNGQKIRLAPERFGLVIDHHLERGAETPDFLPIIRTCGAAASIGWKLLHALGGKADERLSQLTAIGILSDTDRLTHPITQQIDREAFLEAMGLASQQLIHDCFDYRLPERYLSLYEQVLQSAIIVCDEVRIAHVKDLLLEDEGDYLSIFADSLRKVNGAKTVIVWGVAGREVRASVRTSSRQDDLTGLIEAIFGAGNGGSKYGSGGARYALADPHVPYPHTAELLIGFLNAQFNERIIGYLGTRPIRRRTPEKTAT